VTVGSPEWNAAVSRIGAAYDRGAQQELEDHISELSRNVSPESNALVAFARGHLAAMRPDYDEAVRAYDEANRLLRDLDATTLAGDMLSFTCLALYYKGDLEGSLKAGKRALQIHEASNEILAMARDLSNLANVYNERREFDEAMRSYRRSIELYDDGRDPAGKATAMANLGTLYIAMADYPKALEQLYGAGDLLDDGTHEPNVARILGNIGNVHMYMGSFDKALPRYERALEIHRRIGNRKSAAIVLSNMGSMFGQQGEVEKAIRCCREALDEHQAIGDRSGVHFATALLIHFLLKADQTPEAERLLEAIEQERVEDLIVRINLATSRAGILERSGHLDEATRIIENQLALARKHTLRSEASDLHLKLRDLAEKSVDMQGYIQHNREHVRLRQEIAGIETIKRIAEQEEDFRHRQTRAEHQRERHVLFAALPPSVATRILKGERVLDTIDEAYVLYMDIVGFTSLSAHIGADAVVAILDAVFNACDERCTNNGLTKVQTVGDAYIAVAGLPEHLSDAPIHVARAALEIRSVVDTFDIRKLHPDLRIQTRRPFRVRMGLAVGSATAGVLGLERLQYDVWGEAVKEAALMESTCQPGMIQVSDRFANALREAGTAFSEAMMLVPRSETEEPEHQATFWLERTVV